MDCRSLEWIEWLHGIALQGGEGRSHIWGPRCAPTDEQADESLFPPCPLSSSPFACRLARCCLDRAVLAVAGLPCSRLFPFQAAATWPDNRHQGSPAPAFPPGCPASTERDRSAGLTQRQALAPLRGLEETPHGYHSVQKRASVCRTGAGCAFDVCDIGRSQRSGQRRPGEERSEQLRVPRPLV